MSSAVPSNVPPAAAPAKGKGKKGKRASGGRLLWQVPLLLAGLAAFGYGVKTLSKSLKAPPFEDYTKEISYLIQKGRYDDAIKQINAVSNSYGSNKQLGELEKLSGDAYWGAAHTPTGANSENWKRMIEHYRLSSAFGVEWDVPTRERVGEAAVALNDTSMAVDQFEKVIAKSPEALPRHARMLVSAYTLKREESKAVDVVDKMLATKELELDDRVWAICRKIEMSLGAAGTPADLDKAVALANAAVKEIPERNPAGTLLTWIGRAEFEAGRIDSAWEHLSDARSRFVGRTDDDGRAAVLMGKIAQARSENGLAMKLFQQVIAGYPGTTLQAAARLGRAEVLATEKTPTPEMEDDYKFVIGEIRAGEKKNAKARPELVTMEHVRASLQGNYQSYQKAGKYSDALRFLALVNTTGETAETANVYREAVSEERLADELLATARTSKDPKVAAAKREESLKHYGLAADAFMRHAESSTMEDSVYATSLWKACVLMDKAGRSEEAAKLYERFSIQRPRDPHEPEALYSLGRLQQALGLFDKAIETHQRNRKENPRTPPSYLSTVELARCYMAKGGESYKQAEESLLELVQENPNLEPAAAEFRTALFTLGDLYDRWSAIHSDEVKRLTTVLEKAVLEKAPAAEQDALKKKRDEEIGETLKFRSMAILRLDESITRYPNDPQAARATFLLADCYRQSAADIAGELLRNPAHPNREALEAGRVDRLTKAGTLYDDVIARLEHGGGASDEEFLRYSHLNRAECLFDQNQYAAAIKLYDDVATRYAQSLTAVEAYVQIVRAYTAMKEPANAAAAAERARWVLRRIPDQEFDRPPLKLSRKYYEKFLVVGKD